MKIRKIEEQAQDLQKKWLAQAETLRKDFPNFSWEEALKNEDFCKALLNGHNVAEAYMYYLYSTASPTAKKVMRILATCSTDELYQIQALIEDKDK